MARESWGLVLKPSLLQSQHAGSKSWSCHRHKRPRSLSITHALLPCDRLSLFLRTLIFIVLFLLGSATLARAPPISLQRFRRRAREEMVFRQGFFLMVPQLYGAWATGSSLTSVSSRDVPCQCGQSSHLSPLRELFRSCQVARFRPPNDLTLPRIVSPVFWLLFEPFS